MVNGVFPQSLAASHHRFPISQAKAIRQFTRFAGESSSFEGLKLWGRRILYTAVVSAASFGAGVWYATPPNPNKVVKVADGDTFTLASGFRVRIYGIDAPEKKQPFGEDSRMALEKLILGKVVDLEHKGRSLDRKVCVVYLGDIDVGGEMVKVGLAYEAQDEFTDGRYADEQAEAKQNKRGVWTQPNGGMHPAEFRKKTKAEQQHKKNQQEKSKTKQTSKAQSWLGYPSLQHEKAFALILTPYRKDDEHPILAFEKSRILMLT